MNANTGAIRTVALAVLLTLMVELFLYQWREPLLAPCKKAWDGSVAIVTSHHQAEPCHCEHKTSTTSTTNTQQTLSPETTQSNLETPPHSGLSRIEERDSFFRVRSSSFMSRVSSTRATLTMEQPVWPVRSGGFVFQNMSASSMVQGPALLLPPDTTRVMVDVGTFIHSPSSKHWWAHDQKSFVIGIEANPYSQAMMSRIAAPAFLQSVSGYWPSVPYRAPSPFVPNGTYSCIPQEFHDCVHHLWSHIATNADRFALIPMAASDESTISHFQLGFPGRPDSGSLLEFRSAYRKKKGLKRHNWTPVAIDRLSEILSRIPATLSETPGTPLLWDTLKIDAQGVDSLVIAGGGELLSHFACIVGEFDRRGYAGGKKFHHPSYLVYYLGFAQVSHSLFVNRRFEAELVLGRAGRLICSVPDVPISWSKVRTTLAKYNTLYGAWDDSKSWLYWKQNVPLPTSAIVDVAQDETSHVPQSTATDATATAIQAPPPMSGTEAMEMEISRTSNPPEAPTDTTIAPAVAFS